MWEIFTCGDEPYADKSNTEVLELVCSSSARLEKPATCPKDIYQEMRMCWKKVSIILLSWDQVMETPSLPPPLSLLSINTFIYQHYLRETWFLTS